MFGTRSLHAALLAGASIVLAGCTYEGEPPPKPVCGDGVVEGEEVCDDGVNDGTYGGCAEVCNELVPACESAGDPPPCAVLLELHGFQLGDRLGYSVAGGGDADGDGIGDIVAGAAGAGDDGLVYVFSGRTGEVLWSAEGFWEASWYGGQVAWAGDVNGDGFSDVISSALRDGPDGLEDAGTAHVLSGATGELLWVLAGVDSDDRLGAFVAGAGDVDADGFDDVVLSAPRNGGPPATVYVYSGQTGQPLHEFELPRSSIVSVSGAGDVNLDGFADLLIGHPYADFVGAAYVYDGQTGGLLWQFTPGSSVGLFGSAVSPVGDVDGDGFVDVAVLAPGEWAVCIFSGATGETLWEIPDLGGHTIAGVGDIDLDGLADLIGGSGVAPCENQGSAYVFSTQIGALRLAALGSNPASGFGKFVSGTGDIDLDGRPDFAVGAPGESPGGLWAAGSVYVYGCTF